MAASTPAIEAVRIAVNYRTPVVLLADTFLSNSSEPWRLPDVSALPDIDPDFATEPTPATGSCPTCATRSWRGRGRCRARPGLRHRIGGLEKEDVTGNISYEPENHEHMTRLRAERVERVAESVPDLEVDDPDGAELLVLGWGSSYGAIEGAARRVRREHGVSVATAHLHHLNPLPRNTGDVLRSYPRVLIPEMNMGQLATVLRGAVPRGLRELHEGRRMPIFTRDVMDQILERLA